MTKPGRVVDIVRAEAGDAARAAWRGGPMSDASETAILATWGASFVTADHDARIDALLWAGAAVPAQRLLPLVSPAVRAMAQGRLAALSGGEKVILSEAISLTDFLIPCCMPIFSTICQKSLLYAKTCGPKPQGRARWTWELLAERVVELKIVEHCSGQTVMRVLKKTS